MAEDPKKQNESGESSGDGAPTGGKKKLILFGGGGLAVVALAFVAATVALPKKQVFEEFKGPFVAPLTEKKIQVNLAGSKSFLIVNLKLNYEAVSRSYYETRSVDEVYVAELTDVLVSIASSKTREEIEDPVIKPVFLEEVRRAVEPLLFPVHIGETKRPIDVDKASGLAPGLSAHLGTFRGPYGDHVLKVDAGAGTLQLDDGPEVTWEEDDSDVVVENAGGKTLYVDVSRVNEEFVSELVVGVKGRVRRILWNEVLIQ